MPGAHSSPCCPAVKTSEATWVISLLCLEAVPAAHCSSSACLSSSHLFFLSHSCPRTALTFPPLPFSVSCSCCHPGLTPLTVWLDPCYHPVLGSTHGVWPLLELFTNTSHLLLSALAGPQSMPHLELTSLVYLEMAIPRNLGKSQTPLAHL